MLNEDQIFELNALGLLLFSFEDFTIVRINEKAAIIYERHPNDLKGKPLASIFGNKELERLTSLKNQKDDISNQAVVVQTHQIKTGQTRHVRLKLNHLEDENGQPLGLLTLFDITDDVLKNQRISRQDRFLKLVNDFNSALRKGTPYQEWFEEHMNEMGKILNIDELEYLELMPAASGVDSYQLERKFALDNKSKNWPWPKVNLSVEEPPLQTLQKNNPISLLNDRLEPKSAIHKYLINRGGKTYLFVPVCLDEKLRGFLCLEDSESQRTWEKDEMEFLAALADDLGLHLQNKEQRKQIEDSEKKFKELVQGGADLLAIIDSAGYYSYVSPSVQNNLGFDASQLEGTNAFDLIHPDDRQWVASFLEQLEFNASVTIPPYRFKNKAGEWNYITTVLTDKRDHPQIAGIIANSQNITEVVKVKKDLELANERYKLAAQASSDHIYDWDLESNSVERLGHSLEKLWGYHEEDLRKNRGQFWRKCVHPEDVVRVYQELEKNLNNPEVKHFNLRYRFKKASGEYSELLDQSFVIRSKTGKALRLIGAVKDISSIVQREAEENLYLIIANCFSDKFDLEKCLDETIKVLASNTKAVGVEIWLLSADKKQLNLIQKLESPALKGFYEQCAHINQFEKGKAVPGKVWSRGKSFLVPEIEESSVFLRKQAALSSNLRSVIGIPIKQEKEFKGVLMLLASEGYQSIKEDIKILEKIGVRLGSLIAQKLLEDDLNNFFNLSPDFLCILGTDGILKKVNKAIVENTSYSERELLSKPLKSFLHPEDRERGMQQIENALIADEVGYESTRFIGKEGQTIHLIWSSRRDPKKKQVYAVAKDITLRVNAQTELSLAYNRLKQAQRIAKLGYWSRWLEDRNFWWSEQLFNIFDVSPDEFKPNLQNVLKMVHPQDRELVEQNQHKVLTINNELSYRHRIISKAGKTKWVMQRLWLRRDEAGKTIAIEGTIQDISEQIEYEEKLQISNERFQLAMKATREMIWDWDHKTNIITRGMGYESSFGYHPSDTGSKNNSWFSMVHPEDIDRVWKSINTALQNPLKSQWEAEYRILPSANEIAYVIDRGFIIRDEKGKPLRSVGSTLDMTETKQYLEAIQRQNQALRDIAHMQSHVIRAPLARIMGLLGLAEMDKMNPEAVQNYLHLMSESAKELDQVIREITEKTNELES